MSVDGFMSRLNPVVMALLRSPLHGLASRGLLLLDVTGRRSGRTYTIPVGYQREGDDLFVMVSEARKKQWWRNYREASDVTLRLRGRLRRGRAVLLAPDSPAFRERAEQTLRRVPGMARVFRVDFDRRSGLTPAQLAQLGCEIAAVHITLAPEH
jgi:deazaflavin-dependent oxidoreductase (nitroreductase family)